MKFKTVYMWKIGILQNELLEFASVSHVFFLFLEEIY